MTTAWRLLKYVSVGEHASQPGRMLLVVFSVAFGIAVPIAMWLATNAAVAGLSADLSRLAGKAALQVTFGTGEARLPESVVETVRAQPFVSAAAAVLRGSLSFADETRETIEVFGVDLLQKDVRTLHDVEVVARNLDDLPVASDPHVILLSEGVAAERGIAVGDEVELVGPKGTASYTVHGILRMNGFARVYGGRTAVMYLPSAQIAFTDVTDPLQSVVHQIDVALVPGSSVEEAKNALRKSLPPELTVEEPIQRGVQLERSVDGLRATLTGISSIALIAAMFIVYSANVSMIAYRASTFATLRSVGVGHGALTTLVLLEAFAAGIVGGALGIPLGLAMARFALGDVATGMELNYAVRAAPVGLLSRMGPGLLVFVALGGVGSLAAAFVPTRRIRLQYRSVGAASHDDTNERGRATQWWLVALGVIVIALGVFALWMGVSSKNLWACALGGSVTIAGVVLSMLRVVDSLWKRSVRRAVARLGAIGWLASESLVRDTERALVAVAAIAFCGAVAITASTLPTSFRSSAAHWYGFRGDATLASRTSGKGWLPAALLPQHAERVADLPSVESVETLRVVHGQPFRGGRIAVVGLSSKYLDAVASAATGTCPSLGDAPTTGSTAVVSENLARRFDLSAGETVAVESPTGIIDVSICGTIADFTSDQGSIIVPAELLRSRWHDDLVNYISVDLRAGADTSMLRREMTERFGTDHGVMVYDTGELRATIEQVLTDAFREVDGIQLLVFAITFVGIVDLVASAVVDRRREFTLLRAVGARDLAIARSVALETGILGATAGALAVIAGALFAHLWLAYIYPVLVGYVLMPDFSWRAAGTVMVMSFITATVAGYAASRVALRSLRGALARS